MFSSFPPATMRDSAARSRTTSTFKGVRVTRLAIMPTHTAQDLRLTPPFGHAALRRKPDEPARILHLVHHGIAGVHTQATADAFVLQALANVDAHRAHLHTQRAVNAIAQPLGLVVDVLLARPTLLAAFLVVGNDQRVLVEHGALKARIGTHVFAHLFAHIAGIAIGGKAIEQYPENLPAPLHRQQLCPEFADGHEIAHEREPRPQRHGKPDDLLEKLLTDLLEGPRPVVQPKPRTAITFDLVLDPHEHFGVDRLRARKSTPKPPRHRRKQEQR